MAYQVPTYNQRLKRVNTIEDLRNELAGAKRYMMRLRKAAADAKNDAEREAAIESLAKAESVLRQLRRNYFEIEESLVPAG